MDAGRQVSCIVAEGNDEVTELSWAGTRGARMIGVPVGTDAAGNTVGIAAAPTGDGDMNLVLPSAMTATDRRHNYISLHQTQPSQTSPRFHLVSQTLIYSQ